MQPRIRELLDYMERERRALDAAIATVPADRHDTKPSAEAWCVAEVVHHLAVIDRRVTGMLTKMAGEARAAGAEPDDSSAPILPTIKIDHILDRSTRIRNPRGDPPGGVSTTDALKELDAARDGLKALLGQPDLPNLSHVSAPHPAFGPMTGYEWVALISAHTHRHADQIREIGAQLNA